MNYLKPKNYLILTLLIVTSMGACEANKVFTPSRGLTGEIAYVVAGTPDTVWVYSFYQIPAGSGFEVIGGVSQYRESGNWTTYDENDGLVSDILYDIEIDGKLVWFGTINGVSRIDTDSGAWMTLKTKDGLIAGEVRAIAASNKYVWFGTSNGVTAYQKSDGTLRNFTTEDGLLFRFIQDIAVDGSEIYFATGQGISIYNEDSGEWSSITRDDGLLSNSVNSVVVGLDSIWFGTELGVSRLVKSSGDIVQITEADGLPAPGVTSMAASDDRIWFVTKKGVARFQPEKDKWKIIDKNIPIEAINDVAYGKEYAWLATNEGLIRLGGRIPLTYVLIIAVAVVGGAAVIIKLRPIMKAKAERASRGSRRVSGPPPWKRCKGTPSDDVCPLCKYNELRSGKPYCLRYRKKISY
jgi:ligand-binding sensor domain-containing protein